MNRDMFDYKKFIVLTEDNTPSCYIPGLCIERDFVFKKSAHGNHSQPLKGIGTPPGCLAKK